jgi:hypothetical protein
LSKSAAWIRSFCKTWRKWRIFFRCACSSFNDWMTSRVLSAHYVMSTEIVYKLMFFSKSFFWRKYKLTFSSGLVVQFRLGV